MWVARSYNVGRKKNLIDNSDNYVHKHIHWGLSVLKNYFINFFTFFLYFSMRY